MTQVGHRFVTSLLGFQSFASIMRETFFHESTGAVQPADFGWSGQSQAAGPLHNVPQICACLRSTPPGQIARLVLHELVVHQDQRLSRHDAGRSDRTTVGRGRCVEQLHHGHQQLPLHVDVNAAPPVRGILLPDIGPLVALAGRDELGAHPRLDSRPEHPRIQIAADSQHAVAQSLGFQPANVLPPE